ncbi:hypothetical protein FUAX_41340 (plasmid) [Fulvitalea axinellae]|uniref:Uncharacterized protein n=1 Tax=Fulvitalea axinellae TaxID=1182444 RepID=A0AAU9CXD5_9BACT|nr:hypothetical protein FUAX_41340 [Fulvitalea axinellae]
MFCYQKKGIKQEKSPYGDHGEASKSPPKLSLAPIQCKTGFEIEFFNIRVGQSIDQKAYDHLCFEDGKKNILPKGDKLFKAPLFDLEAEEGSYSSDSALEIVSIPFEEDDEGFYQLSVFFRQLRRFYHILNTSPSIITLIDFERQGLGRIVKDRILLSLLMFHRGARIRAQATSGVRMGMISPFIKDFGMSEDDESFEMAERRKAGRLEIGSDTAHGYRANLILLGRATLIAEEALRQFWKLNPDLRYRGPSPHLQGLLNLVAAYLIRGTQGVGAYAKAFMTILARTDFKKMFDLLPSTEWTYLSRRGHEKWDELIHLMCSPSVYQKERTDWSMYSEPEILMPACDAKVIDLKAPFFAKGIYRDRVFYNKYPTTVLDKLSSGMWACSIPEIDYLTQKNFPDKSARPRLESIGGLGRQTDLNLRTDEEMPIFEMRSLPVVHGIEPVILQLRKWFAYMYELNRGEDYKYGEPHEKFGVEAKR